MKVSIFLVLIVLVSAFGSAQAQTYTAAWYWYNDTGTRLPLTDGCVAGTPFLDGTPVVFVWDNDANGADDDDPLPTICAIPPECASGPAGTVDINQFGMNGQATGDGAGFFEMDTYFQANGPFTNPRFFLRVCGNGMRWQSNVFTLTSGLPQEFQPSQIVWTCMNTPCPGCSSPTAPSLITASTNRCDGIMVNWTAVTDTSNDGYILSRDGNWLATITDPATQQYMDNGVSVGDHSYSVLVRHICNATDSASSSLVTAPGHRVLNPPTPTAGTVTATDATCNQVTVQWSFATTAGLDWWVITRNGDSVGTVSNAGSPGQRTFVHTTPLSGQANYCVYGASAGCGWGVPGCDNGTALQPAPVPTGVTASDGLCNTINISWTDVAGETGYQVYRQDSGGGNEISIGNVGANVTTFPYTLGACTTVYRFVVRSTSACGNSAPSVFDNGSMLCSPSTPTGFTASDSASCSGVILNWSDVTGETYYRIMRGITSPIDSIGNVSAGFLTFTDFTTIPGNVYQYAVAAVNACGSNTSVANQGSRKTVPAQVTGVSASDANCGAVIVTWNNVTSEDSFQVRRNGTQIGRTFPDVLQFNDSTALPGVTYSYSVIALNSCGAGNESASEVGGRSVGLPAPANVTASTDQCFSIFVSWNDLAAEDSFQIRRNGVRVGSVNTNITSFSDNSAPPQIPHSYTVVGYNGCGAGNESAIAIGEALTSPATPTNVVASDSLCSGVLISWTDVAYENEYLVKRNGAPIAFVPQDSTTYLDTPPAGTYSYRVQAFNDCGASPNSSADNGTRFTAPLPPSNFSQTGDNCGVISLSWTNPLLSRKTYVYRNSFLIDSVAIPAATYSDDIGVAGTYLYYLIAENHCGVSDTSVFLNAVAAQFPTTPENLSATDNDCNDVTLHWNASPGTVDRYIIYRYGVRYDSTAGTVTTFHDTNIVTGNVYSYNVSALSTSCGETTLSNEASADVEMLTPPASPQIVITTAYPDIHLAWPPVTQSVSGCPVSVTGYLVYYSPTNGGTYYYHGFTVGTSYVHVRAAQFAETTFYRVVAYSGPVSLVASLPKGETVTMEEVERRLR